GQIERDEPPKTTFEEERIGRPREEPFFDRSVVVQQRRERPLHCDALGLIGIPHPGAMRVQSLAGAREPRDDLRRRQRAAVYLASTDGAPVTEEQGIDCVQDPGVHASSPSSAASARVTINSSHVRVRRAYEGLRSPRRPHTALAASFPTSFCLSTRSTSNARISFKAGSSPFSRSATRRRS